jgi:hypothetical protein
MFLMMIINAVVMRQAFVESANLYWVLILTVPLLIFAVVRFRMSGQKITDNRNAGDASGKVLYKQRSELIKTTNYDYAKF